MAFTTYAELQAAILARMDRSDLTTEVVDWITLAESDITRWLRASWIEKRAYATPDNAFIVLPTDYNGMRNLQWDYQNYRLPLTEVSPDMIDKMNPSTTAGVPEFFCVHDGQIELRPAPSGDNTTTIEISYYAKPTALSDSNTSNEILVNAPDLLFARALAEGFDYILDDNRAQKWLSRYNLLRADILKEDQKLKWSGKPLRVMADSLRMMG